MPRTLFTTLSLLLTTACGTVSQDDPTTAENASLSQYNNGAIQFRTNKGKFVIELYDTQAPKTTDNFLRYVEDGFYDGKDGNGKTIFHRTINDFMIQGGGLTEDGSEKSTYPPIENESIVSGLSNVRGTVAMARTNDPNSATAQFFINTMDNTYLDAGEITEEGYAVFGLVVDGMEIVDEISEGETDGNDRPIENVVIEDVWLVE